MINKICCIFNYAPHYREEIYKKIGDEFNVEFYFGDIEKSTIKKMDYSVLGSKVVERKTYKLLGSINYISKSMRLSFSNYSKYIITGEPYCISSWLILIFNRLLGKQTFTWTHGWYGSERGIKKFIKRIYFSLSHKILLYGEKAKALMIEEGFSENKLEVIYNSLNYEKQLLIRNSLSRKNIYKDYFENIYPVIIFTGRLTEVKKLDQLILALNGLHSLGHFFNLFIIGDGPCQIKMKEMVSQYNLNKFVYFYGECYEEALIADFYYNSLCCVSPGNVGLTGIHAMTYGCPVISHDNFFEQMPEVEVIKDLETGLYFKQDNIGDLSSKILQIQKFDREILKDNCQKIIDTKFNTRNQINILKRNLN